MNPRCIGPWAKTCGSLLAALDVHPRVAMQILRHSKIAVTMEIYIEVPSDATVMRFASSATGSHDRCCRSLLPRHQNGQLQDRNWPLSWVGDTGIEPVTSSV
jgi:hypothetical protein